MSLEFIFFMAGFILGYLARRYIDIDFKRATDDMTSLANRAKKEDKK